MINLFKKSGREKVYEFKLNDPADWNWNAINAFVEKCEADPNHVPLTEQEMEDIRLDIKQRRKGDGRRTETTTCNCG